MQRLRTTRGATSLLILFALVAAACTEATAVTTTTPTSTTIPRATTTTEEESECPTEFCVKYNIRPEAAWADGTPVTANDFAFTFDTIMNDQLDIGSREGYDKMSGYEIVDAKTFIAAFNENYGAWRNLFNAVIPEHELKGKPFNSYWDNGITLGSGPFIMTEWIEDERIVLQRNPRYWAEADPASGSPLGDVQTINILFLGNTDTQIQAMRDSEVDVFYPEPTLLLAEDVASMDGVEWEAGLGLTWEHIDFNQDDPLLSQLFVRQAIATGIDRDAIVEAVVRPIAANAQPLGNTVWLNTSSHYEDHFADYQYDPVRAEAYLTDNGCTKGDDGIYVCDGVRLSFNWATTTGHQARELHFALAQANLAEIGIEVNAAFRPASEMFFDDFFFGDSTVWQIMNFAWVGSPDPVRLNSIYYCEGDAPNGFGALNLTRYCNDEIEGLIRATETEVDPMTRASLYNQADALYLADAASIPLYQTPTLLAWNSAISGPQDNSTRVGPFWNVSSWTGKEIVNFSTVEEPESVNIFEPDTDLLASTIATTILEGAYTIAPDFSYVPVLITSTELIVAGE